MRLDDAELTRLDPADAGEALTLQRAAFVTEASVGLPNLSARRAMAAPASVHDRPTLA